MHKSKMEIFFKRKIVTQNFILSYLYRYHYLLSLSLVKDRKSTRLNSSHLVISYAVFCLKKKNILAYFFVVRGNLVVGDVVARTVVGRGLVYHFSIEFFCSNCLSLPRKILPIQY